MTLSERLEAATMIEESLRSMLIKARKIKRAIEAQIEQEIKPDVIKQAEAVVAKALRNSEN